jgi:alkaline phosphatase D
MKRLLIFALALNGWAVSAQTTAPLSRIAFGSGLDTDNPQLIWHAVENSQPELFVLPGVIAGTNAVAATNCPIWSAQIGGYEARIFGPPGKQVQVILLDTQSFREPPGFGALLGARQWTWFREQLRKPAQVRVVASGIPVLSRDHRGEKWADWPRDHKLMFDMISDTEADGILFISGARHQAELSVINDAAPYPLYDLTSSPMNMKASEPVVEINRHGISDVVRDNNHGLIAIDWSRPDPAVTLEIRDEKGTPRIQHGITLSVLQTAHPAP